MMADQYAVWVWDMLRGIVDKADALELWNLYPSNLREIDASGTIWLFAWSNDQQCRFAPIVLRPLDIAA